MGISLPAWGTRFLRIMLFMVIHVVASRPSVTFAMQDFRRGNTNSDGTVDISDALYTLSFLFLGGPAPVCADAADANDDGTIDISDVLHTLSYLFLGSEAPSAPGPVAPGPDPTPDGLVCGSELRCDSPANGELVDLVPGARISIHGTASGLVDVRVNGELVPVAADHTFSTTVAGRYGLSFVELSGTDGAGATHSELCAFLGAERWLEEGERFDEALALRFEPPGFNKLTSLIPPWLDANIVPRLDSSLLAGNPIFQSNCGAVGSCVTELRYLSLVATFDPGVKIRFTSQASLNVTVQMDLRVRLRVRSKLFGVTRPSVDGEVIFTNALIDGEVRVGIDPATGRPRAHGESINSTEFGTISTQFTGLDPELLDTVASVTQEIIAERLRADVLGGSVDLFEGLFAGLDVVLPASGFPVQRLDGTGNVTVDLEQRWGVELRNNGLTLSTALSLREPSPPPAATGRIPLPIAADPANGSARLEVDVWSATQVGVFNQVLQALWRAGLFDGTIDGAALGPGLPAETSVSVELGTMPVVTGFDPDGLIGLDMGALDLLVAGPGFPPGVRVTAGARTHARASLLSDDLAFDDFAIDEVHISTGSVTLDAASRATLQHIVERLFVKLADVALNDSLPVLPAPSITIPASLGAYGLPVGTRLVGSPRLVTEAHHVFLEGELSSQ